ncbi:MAG TPA: general stress protein [Ktedonobacterales bacterium]
MTRSVVGLFANQEQAERAISDLESAGFDPTHMGIAMRDRRAAKDVAEAEGISSTAGAVTGGLVGGTAGALLAAAGALVVPGIGPFLAGGILAGALVGGAAGRLIGGLVGLGVPEQEAKYYQQRVEGGSVLLTVATPYRGREAWEIMRQDGAEDLREKGFGGYPNDEAAPERASTGRPYTEPPNAEVDGTIVPPDNRQQTVDEQGNAVSSLTSEHGYQQQVNAPQNQPRGVPETGGGAPTANPAAPLPPDGQSSYQPGPLPPDGQPNAQPQPLPPDESITVDSPQSAHVPPERVREVEEGGFDAPDHPMLDKDIIAEDTGHAGQPQRPPL